MIKGIGIDIVEITRIKKALVSKSFVSRVYTEKEQQYCQSRGKQQAQSYAARFSGKEAVLVQGYAVEPCLILKSCPMN